MNRPEMPIFVRTFDCLAWLLPATNHFPRAHRNTFTRRLLDAAFDLRERLEEANFRKDAARLDRLAQADMLLFGDSKHCLWRWLAGVRARLARLRLTIHAGAHPRPVQEGIPFLGFVVQPQHRRLKRRKAVQFARTLKRSFAAWRAGALSRAQLDAQVNGWLNHARFGNTIGLQKALLARWRALDSDG